MPPTESNEQEQIPFTPADPNPSITGNTTDPLVAGTAASDLPADHPATDTNIDSTELYDEGISGAAEVEDNSAQSAVASFTPPDNDTDDTTSDEAL